VWGYTPRQAYAFCKLAETRRRREAAEQLSLATLAARGDPKDVEQQIREWSR
jgi:hypothetical protein